MRRQTQHLNVLSAFPSLHLNPNPHVFTVFLPTHTFPAPPPPPACPKPTRSQSSFSGPTHFPLTPPPPQSTPLTYTVQDLLNNNNGTTTTTLTTLTPTTTSLRSVQSVAVPSDRDAADHATSIRIVAAMYRSRRKDQLWRAWNRWNAFVKGCAENVARCERLQSTSALAERDAEIEEYGAIVEQQRLRGAVFAVLRRWTGRALLAAFRKLAAHSTARARDSTRRRRVRRVLVT